MGKFRRQIAWVMLLLALPGQVSLWLHSATHHHCHVRSDGPAFSASSCESCEHSASVAVQHQVVRVPGADAEDNRGSGSPACDLFASQTEFPAISEEPISEEPISEEPISEEPISEEPISEEHCAVCYSLAVQFTEVSSTLGCLEIASVPTFVLTQPVSVPTSLWMVQPEVRGPPPGFFTA